MIDGRQTTRSTRPRRFASERAKAYFLSDASIAKQLEKEERDLQKAMRVSRMEALKVRRNGIERKNIKSSSSESTASTSSSSSSSSSSTPNSPLLSLPTTPTTPKTPKTKVTTKTTTRRTACSVEQKRKPKAMEILSKNMKGSGKTVNQIKPLVNEKPKLKAVVRTRSQNNTNNNNNSTSQHVNNSLESKTDKKVFKCDKKPNLETFKPNGSTTQLKNGSTTQGISPLIPCATLQLGKGISDLLNLTARNGENCDKPRPKIMAQRKFASITYSNNCNTYLKSRETDFSPVKELFTKHKPSAEDFLTFLCFKSTDLLPPHLDFYSLNNISSTDGSNDPGNGTDKGTTTANDLPASGSNLPINKSSNLKQASNINNSTTSTAQIKKLTNGKNQCVRKRVNLIVTPVDPPKEGPNLVESSKNINHVNRKNSNRSNKKTSDSETMRNNNNNCQRTNKAVKISARSCKSPTRNKSTNPDENRSKKSATKRSPKPSARLCHYKPPTKVKISTQQNGLISNNDSNSVGPTIKPILKVSKNCQPKISNAESYNKSRADNKKTNCDRILRSTRSSTTSSSSSPSNEPACLILEATQLTNGKRNVKQETLDLTAITENFNSDVSAIINGNDRPTDQPERKRKCNVSEMITDNGGKKRRVTITTALSSSPSPSTTVVVSMLESRQSKKNDEMDSSKSSLITSNANSNNLRKSSTNGVIPHRIETRSHTKR